MAFGYVDANKLGECVSEIRRDTPNAAPIFDSAWQIDRGKATSRKDRHHKMGIISPRLIEPA
jgi:hypothetical protein